MPMNLSLTEHWYTFLLQNPDARLVIDGFIARTGSTDDEVLFLLIDEWAGQNLTPERQPEFYASVFQGRAEAQEPVYSH